MSSLPSPEDPPSGEPHRYVGALLRVAWQWVRDEMYAGVVAAGYADLNAAHVGLWRHPGLDGLRPSQLADRAGITKQSVNDLLGHLEEHGYLVRRADPEDGRARVIRLTSKGRRLEQTIYARAASAEGRIVEMLGTRQFAQMRRGLEELAAHVAQDGPSSPQSD